MGAIKMIKQLSKMLISRKEKQVNVISGISWDITKQNLKLNKGK